MKMRWPYLRPRCAGHAGCRPNADTFATPVLRSLTILWTMPPVTMAPPLSTATRYLLNIADPFLMLRALQVYETDSDESDHGEAEQEVVEESLRGAHDRTSSEALT
jgi:hypothetical protein